MAIKSFSIRIDSKMLDKLHIISSYEGRSANSHVCYLIRNAILEFEKKNGKITSDFWKDNLQVK